MYDKSSEIEYEKIEYEKRERELSDHGHCKMCGEATAWVVVRHEDNDQRQYVGSIWGTKEGAQEYVMRQLASSANDLLTAEWIYDSGSGADTIGCDITTKFSITPWSVRQ